MTPLSQFLPRLLVFVPACSNPLAEQALLDSAIQFCRDSAVLRQVLSDVVVPNVSTYELDLPAKHTLGYVRQVTLNNKELTPIAAELATIAELPVRRPAGYSVRTEDCALSLAFDAKPDATYSMRVEVVLEPSRDATAVDDVLFTRWQEAIVFGALAKLLMIPGQAFTNFGAAPFYSTQAAKMTHNARIDASYGQVRGSLTVKSRPFK